MVIYSENYLDFSLDGQHLIAPNISFNDAFITFFSARICVLVVVIRGGPEKHKINRDHI